jgi:hypothetical protein
MKTEAIVTLVAGCLIALVAYTMYVDYTKLNAECKAKGGELMTRDNICAKKL